METSLAGVCPRRSRVERASSPAARIGNYRRGSMLHQPTARNNRIAGNLEDQMKRRSFLGSVAAVSLASQHRASAAIPKMKITRVRAYAPPNLNILFNQ